MEVSIPAKVISKLYNYFWRPARLEAHLTAALCALRRWRQSNWLRTARHLYMKETSFNDIAVHSEHNPECSFSAVMNEASCAAISVCLVGELCSGTLLQATPRVPLPSAPGQCVIIATCVWSIAK